MKTLPRYCLLLLASLALTACGGLQNRQVMGDRSLTPLKVAQALPEDNTLVVEWGGVIVETRNLESTTEIQVIAYPLRKNGKPDLDDPPVGRFIAISEGYLESADYSKGRTLTLSGTLLGLRKDKVGEADYTFPLLKPLEIELWPPEKPTEPKSRWHFGIGVGTGGSRGSIGVGIGL